MNTCNRSTFIPPMFVSSCKKKSKTDCTRVARASLATDHLDEEITVTATVSVKLSKKFDVNDTMIKQLPWLYKSMEKGLCFQLVSTQLDPTSMKPKLSKELVKDWSKGTTTSTANDSGCFSFKVEMVIGAKFGEPGAILVRNNYDKELFMETISLEGFFHFTCNSWVQPAHTSKQKRIFFSNKAYLPSQTPKGLIYLRATELENKRGDGNGHRLPWDRIYDYDTYNDLGNPDKGVEFARPTLGGARNPHPRRCRTGRPSSTTDVASEKPVNTMISSTYVPRDEALEGTRRTDILMGILKGVFHNIPPVMATLFNENGASRDIAYLTAGLYRNVQQAENIRGLLDIRGPIEDIFKFKTPKNMSWNVASYIEDVELGRQTLAGMNPVSIERLKVFPPMSKLDPSIYGPPESVLKEEDILCHLNGMSVQQALDENKVFILDYHDIYLPFLERINGQEGQKAYATRTIFFLTTMGTLKPIAIELSLSAKNSSIPSKQVLTPPLMEQPTGYGD